MKPILSVAMVATMKFVKMNDAFGRLRLQNYERPQVFPVTVEHVPIVYQPSLAE